MIHLTIDGQPVEVPAGTSVLEAARKINVKIPTLCYLKGVNAIGSCRLCVVDSGARSLSAACVLPVSEGMNVKTNTPAVREARKMNLELLLSIHERKCLSCVRNTNCELQTLCEEMGIIDEDQYAGEIIEKPQDHASPSVWRDPQKCILCRRCVATCATVQKIGVVGATGRGFSTMIEPAWHKHLTEVPCINCGQCIGACPVGALREDDDTQKVWDAIGDPDKIVVVQPAPAVRIGIGEEFGLPMGSRETGKLAAALRRMGFDYIFDTDFGADLTVMEEGTELIGRIKNGGKLPMLTSCSPGWVKYLETYYPDFIDNMSTCKSPMMMTGAIIKTYFAQANNIDPSKIVSVAVMPCSAKKFEITREELHASGQDRDVDYVITTRELGRMIKEAGIDFLKLPDESFDPMLGDSTGAAAIFGATGGVMEAALRTVYEVVTGETLDNVDFNEVRGTVGIKEATVKMGDLDVNVAVANGTANCGKILDQIRSGEKTYHIVEMMACPGGCINGGGQPLVSSQKKIDFDPREERSRAIYAEDKSMPLRKSHENPSVQKLYKDFLGEPNSEKAHHLLHTHYAKREKY